jgi:FixJ family two-component response regulator
MVAPAPEGSRKTQDAKPVVFVVDDDPSFREALETMIRMDGWDVRAFEAAKGFLDSDPAPGASCLVLDVNLPDLSGLDLQTLVARNRPDMPVIIMTGDGDIPKTVRAMKAGAVEFLTKPFDGDILLGAIKSAMARSAGAVAERASIKAIQDRYDSLSSREKEVMLLVVGGLLNKQVGGELGISEITVKAHRGRVMEKMRAVSLPELVKMSARLGLTAPRGR